MIADLNSMVAAFRGLRLTGEPQTIARLLYMMQISCRLFTAPERPKDGTANPFIDGIESLKGDDFKAATDQLGLSFRMD